MSFESAEVRAAWQSGCLDELIVRALDPIVGEAFMYMGRAADMIDLGFGDVVDAPTSGDPARRVPRHCLHAQCRLRLDSDVAIVTTSRDIYRSVDNAGEFADDWERGANMYDRALDMFWLEHPPGSAVVTGVSADRYGGARIALSSGHSIKIFPSFSGLGESWRYFQINSDEHFVILPGSL